MTTTRFVEFVAEPTKVFLFGFLIVACSQPNGVLRAQPAPVAIEQFEVASIRPVGTNAGHPSVEFTRGGGMRALNAPLTMLIEIAYDIRPDQLSGGPGWTDSEQYTVVAKGPDDSLPLSGAEERALTRKRLQTLLIERFHLAVKHETKPASGYVLTVVKTGHKMTVSNDSTTHMMRQVGRWQLRAEGVEMSLFAQFLGVHLQATVVDQTGLGGRYNFELNWMPQPFPSSMESLAGLPEDSLISAVQEQLGLRLVQQKVAAGDYIIEHAERPTVN